MGAGESKEAGAPSQHVFAADQPVRFSSELVDSLQNSPETDSTRARNLELRIQSRVTAELEKLASESAQNLSSLTAQATSDPAPQENSDPSLLDKAKSALTGNDSRGESKQLSRDSVQKEITALREKLEARKKVEKMDAGVEKAREELVACLRTNDRRPLDCWQEVEGFKKEVGRLERKFIEGALR